VAYLFSLLATVFPRIFPPAFRDMNGSAPVYFEASAAIVTLVLLGQVVELRARTRTGAAIPRSARYLTPKTARILRGHRRPGYPLEQVETRRSAAVRPGEKYRLMAWCSKEQLDQRIDAHRGIDAGRKQPGSPVIGASVNVAGSFVMRAERVGSETLLAQIVRLVARPQRSRAPIPAVGGSGGRLVLCPWSLRRRRRPSSCGESSVPNRAGARPGQRGRRC